MPDFAFAELLTYYVIAINFCAFAAFGWDKARAESGGWRVREDTLVSFVVFGGIMGALAGRALFRHKTRKKSFSQKLWGGFFMHLLLLGGIYFYVTGEGDAPRAAWADTANPTAGFSW